MRIDSHAHPYSNPVELPDLPQYRSRCQAAGIDGVVLIGFASDLGMDTVNTWILDAAAQLGEFVIAVPIIDMDRATPEEIERLFDRGARGIKFIRPDASYRDERYYPLYEAVKRRGGVGLFHTGYLMHTPDYHPRYRSGMDDMRPAHLDTVLRWVPHLKVLMAHFGNPFWEECWKVMVSHPTVYADLSGGTAIHRSMGFWKELLAPNGQPGDASLERLCFGTDLGYFPKDGTLSDRLGQYVDFYERLLDQIGAPAALRERVYAGNIRTLFGS